MNPNNDGDVNKLKFPEVPSHPLLPKAPTNKIVMLGSKNMIQESIGTFGRISLIKESLNNKSTDKPFVPLYKAKYTYDGNVVVTYFIVNVDKHITYFYALNANGKNYYYDHYIKYYESISINDLYRTITTKTADKYDYIHSPLCYNINEIQDDNKKALNDKLIEYASFLENEIRKCIFVGGKRGRRRLRPSKSKRRRCSKSKSKRRRY